MKKASALQSALRSSGSSPKPPPEPANDAKQPARSRQPAAALPAPQVQASRRETKPLTFHYPEEVRRQLKALAADEGRNMDDMGAEALNLLFAKYRKPEIAPRKSEVGK